jgi:hypothetical protein
MKTSHSMVEVCSACISLRMRNTQAIGSFVGCNELLDSLG